jgi:hypothetical protein
VGSSPDVFGLQLSEACHLERDWLLKLQTQPRKSMKENIGQIQSVLSQLAATIRAERQVREKMFPHVRYMPNQEYPFGSRDEIITSYLHAALDLDADLQKIATTARRMPSPFGDMFCYMVYCDLHERMKLYQQLAEELLRSGAGDASEVISANKAPVAS